MEGNLEGPLQKWQKVRWKSRYFVLVKGMLREYKARGARLIASYHVSLVTIIPHIKKPRKFKI
jgi:hypothetical protein